MDYLLRMFASHNGSRRARRWALLAGPVLALPFLTGALQPARAVVVSSRPPAGTVFVANRAANTITEYAPGANGNAAPAVTISGANTQLSGPVSVVLDSTGDLFVTNTTSDTVTEYAPGAKGNATPIANISGSNTGLSFPDDVAINSAGDLFVSNSGASTVTEYAHGATGNVTPLATINPQSFDSLTPGGMAFNAAGDLFAAVDEAAAVVELPPGASGNVTPLATIVGLNTGLENPENVALDSSDDLYVANSSGSPSITEYSPGANGNASPFATIGGSNTGLSQPVGLGFNSSGDLFAANWTNNTVTEYSPGANGNVAPIATISGTNTGLSSPVDLAVEPAPPPGPVAHLRWNPSPLALAGSLKASKVVDATVTATDKAGRPVGGAEVYLWFRSGSSRGDSASAKCGSQHLPGYCTAHSNGAVNVTYTSSRGPFPYTTRPLRGGTDTLFAALDPGGTKLATDSYSYLAPARAPVTQLIWDPSPAAKPGSLPPGSSTALTLTAEDIDGNPVGDAAVYLQLTPAPGSGGSIKIITRGCAAVPHHPDISKCRTNQTGQITVDYKTSAATPAGSDAIGATTDIAAKYPAWTWDTYTYRQPATRHLRWNPSPLAVAGSLAAGKVVNVTVTATGTAGEPVRGAKVYLWFQRGRSQGDNATAACGGSHQPLPGYCTADNNGVIHVAYHSSPGSVHGALRGGTDILSAALDPGGTGLSTDSYTYLAPAGAQAAQLVWDPSPVAKPGSLAEGSTTTLTMTAEDTAGNPVGRALVYLQLTPAPDSDAATTITTPGCTAVPHHINVHECRADKTGRISVDYKSSTGTPMGSDAIGATLQAMTKANPYPTWTWDTYSYKGKPTTDHLQWSPSPLATAGSLAAGSVVDATLTATSKANKGVDGAKVYLWFQRGSSRGDNAIATCGTTQQPLPGYCTANKKGVINVAYTSTTAPRHRTGALLGGTDTLFAALDPGGTKLTTDSYSYLAPPRSAITQLVWSPDPAAPSGTLAPGSTTTLTLTADDAAGNPVGRATVYLLLTPAPGSAAKIDITTPGCTGVRFHPGISKCKTDKTGEIIVDYKTSATSPAGTDAIGASVTNPATDPHAILTWDTYTYG